MVPALGSTSEGLVGAEPRARNHFSYSCFATPIKPFRPAALGLAIMGSALRIRIENAYICRDLSQWLGALWRAGKRLGCDIDRRPRCSYPANVNPHDDSRNHLAQAARLSAASSPIASSARIAANAACLFSSWSRSAANASREQHGPGKVEARQ
jgi:hypothetical protein